jgi:hypothetical protein
VVDATPTEPLTAEENAEIEELLASEAGFNGTIDTGFGRLCVLIEKRDYDETTLRLVPRQRAGYPNPGVWVRHHHPLPHRRRSQTDHRRAGPGAEA